MGKIRLKIPPFLAVMMKSPDSDWLIIEYEIGEESTIGDVLTKLASSYPNFREVIFNPDLGHVCSQVNVVINDSLLLYQESTRTRLKDGDVIMLLPIHSGG
jgi:molybdopterin converting factor small subunit